MVNMCPDFGEVQALRRQQEFRCDSWEKQDQFLQFNDRELLECAGKISKKTADEKTQFDCIYFTEQQCRLK